MQRANPLKYNPEEMQNELKDGNVEVRRQVNNAIKVPPMKPITRSRRPIQRAPALEELDPEDSPQ